MHFLPENVLRKVWAYFDRGAEHYGTAWPVHYRLPEPDRVAVLRDLGVATFAPLRRHRQARRLPRNRPEMPQGRA